MRWLKTLVAVTVLTSTSIPLNAYAATPVVGKACSKIGQVVISKSIKYVCIKSGKKLVWSKSVTPKQTPAATPRPTATPTASTGGLVLAEPKPYPKNLGSFNTTASSTTQSISTPGSLTVPPADSNVKIWIYEPTTKAAIASRGIFVSANGGGFTFLPSNADGTFYAKWSQGSYLVDVVEPNPTNYLRKRYTAAIDTSGKLSIQDMLPNANGYFTLTVDLPVVLNPMLEDLKKKLLALASVPVSSFKPTSPCQLVDQVTPQRGIQVDLSAGFPKVPQRLPSFGRIKALIVPVDFSDIQGTDSTVSYFSPVANGVRDFYYAQSYRKLAFDFDIVSSWVRAPFTSTKFGTGGSVGAGDVGGYLKAIISFTDGAIDYSGYDAVYFLVPKEMPMANMGWGPAITSPNWTSNGVILNGATGGADMYHVERNGIIGGRWKWMAHETGHALGLYDEDLDHKSQSLGYWGIMAMSWSNQAIELGAWDRYLQGWLPQLQVNCTELNSLTAGGVSTKISPIVRQDNEVKTIMVPITSSKILVIESRKSEGLDSGIQPLNQGVLVYTVDMKKGQLGGGYEIQKRLGSRDQNFEDAALRTGDSVTVGGVTITVTELSESGDTVKISKG